MSGVPQFDFAVFRTIEYFFAPGAGSQTDANGSAAFVAVTITAAALRVVLTFTASNGDKT